MEEPSSINSNSEDRASPAGNYAGRKRRLQQDCTVKLFPPISPSTASPTNQGSATANLPQNSHKSGRGQHSCCCCCKCKKHQRSRCSSRAIDSALSSCSSSTASSWSSCSSGRSSISGVSSNCSSLVGRRDSSPLGALSRSREVKDVLKRIAQELASDGNIIGRNGNVIGDSRGDPHAPPPSRVLTGVRSSVYIIILCIFQSIRNETITETK